MRFLITGANGMLGQDLQRVLAGSEVTALGRAALDVTDGAAFADAAEGHDVVINAAAYTRVDAAEEDEQTAYAVNALGARNAALAAATHGARLLQLSTDYVFDGSASSPYPEDTPLRPLSAYGRTKAEGERLAQQAHPEGSYIVRTAWLYGAGGPNFVKTMLRLAGERDTVRVVDDQRGQPTWTYDLAQQLARLAVADAPAGVYHGTNAGEVTWFGFTREIFRLAGLDPQRVLPTDSTAFVRPAPRPAYSVLGHGRWAAAGLDVMRPWQEAIAAAFADGAFDPVASGAGSDAAFRVEAP